MSDEAADERLRLIRATRQRLDGLVRDGLDRIPSPGEVPPTRIVVEARLAPAPAAVIVRETSTPPRSEPVAAPPAVPQVAPSLFGEADFDAPPLPGGDRAAVLASLAAEVSGCTLCPLLAATRTQTVFGCGDPSARLMFVGEAPGADEDRLGIPFVGRSGMLLNDMITKGMGLRREDVYIANVLKSRPPENRTPMPDEVAHCLPYLERQVDVVRPGFLCLLGKSAAAALLETALPMTRLRGKWHRYRGIPTLVTYHPAYLLRNPDAKKDAWEDLKMLMAAMGLNRKA